MKSNQDIVKTFVAHIPFLSREQLEQVNTACQDAIQEMQVLESMKTYTESFKGFAYIIHDEVEYGGEPQDLKVGLSSREPGFIDDGFYRLTPDGKEIDQTEAGEKYREDMSIAWGDLLTDLGGHETNSCTFEVPDDPGLIRTQKILQAIGMKRQEPAW